MSFGLGSCDVCADGYLMLQYLISPLMAAVCSLGLTVVRSVQDRSG